MTSKEFIQDEIDNTKEILERAKKEGCQEIVEQCEEDIEQYNQVLKDLEMLELLNEWLVYDEYEDAIMTYNFIPLDLKEKIKRWLDNEKL